LTRVPCGGAPGTRAVLTAQVGPNASGAASAGGIGAAGVPAGVPCQGRPARAWVRPLGRHLRGRVGALVKGHLLAWRLRTYGTRLMSSADVNPCGPSTTAPSSRMYSNWDQLGP
jgi:hypothetical protein